MLGIKLGNQYSKSEKEKENRFLNVEKLLKLRLFERLNSKLSDRLSSKAY